MCHKSLWVIVMECRQEYVGAPIGFSVSFGGNKHIMMYCVLLICSQKSIMLEWKQSVQSNHVKLHQHEEHCGYLHSEHEALCNSDCKAWTLIGTCTICNRNVCGCKAALWAGQKALGFSNFGFHSGGTYCPFICIYFFLSCLSWVLVHIQRTRCDVKCFGSSSQDLQKCITVILSSWKFLAVHICVCVCIDLYHTYENNVICM